LSAQILGGLLLVELAVRFLFPDMAGANIVARLTNERPVWARPDAEFHYVGDGIYGLKFPGGRDASPNRIMIVGDSFAMGHGVGEAGRFGHLLQQHLGRDVTVDVLATSSHSPVIYRNVVRRALASASYHAVVVFVDQTDPADDLIYDEDLVERDSSWSFDLDRMTDREVAVNGAYADLLRRASEPARGSAIVNLLWPMSLQDYFKPGDRHYRYVKMSLARSALIRTFNTDPGSDESRRMLSLITEHLDQIVSQCRERNVPLFLAANPWEFQSARRPRVTLQMSGPFPKDNRLEAILTERYGTMPGVHVIPLTRVFREQDDPSGLFLDFPGHEIHWNAKGHRVVEAVLREQLATALPELTATHPGPD
jgi:hypothetical protein